jgi:hypothetical protein
LVIRNIFTRYRRCRLPPSPDIRRIEIRSVKDVDDLRTKVLGEAQRTDAWLRGFKGSPLELFTALRFEPVGKHRGFPFVSAPAGYDPLTGEPLNLIDQINETFMILLSLRAVESLIEEQPKTKGFRLALATSTGGDIKSVEPNLVAAKVAAYPGTTPKFKNDNARLASDPAQYRYLFFAEPTFESGQHVPVETLPGVELICVWLHDHKAGKTPDGVKPH